MRCALTALLALAAILPCPADDRSIPDLVRALDDDSPEAREEAERQLRALGDRAETALLQGLETGPAEVRARARRLLRAIAVTRALEKLSAAELRRVWTDVEQGEPAVRRRAIRIWVEACGRKPETVESLLELLTLDIGGPAGSAACEALNLLCAPRMTGALEMKASGRTFRQGEPLEDLIIDLLGKAGRMSDAAAEVVRGVAVLEHNEVRAESHLTQLRRYCQWAAVAWRMDDAAGTVSIELPAEALAVWRPWWDGVKRDRLALMDMGLVAIPARDSLTDDEVRPWLELLSSADPRHARVARRVLRDLGEEQAAQLIRLSRRPDSPAALREFGERLGLRTLGWLTFETGMQSERRIRVAAGDASRARELIPGASCWHLTIPGGQREVGYAFIGATWKEGAYHRIDLSGKTPPVRVAEPGWRAILSPDATSLFTYHDDIPDSLAVVDLASGRRTPIRVTASSRPEWSSRAGKFCVVNWKERVVHFRDLADPTFAASADVGGPVWDGWSPDGAHYAVNRLLEKGAAPGVGGRRQIELIDPATGERRAVIGPVESTTLGRPAWSPDGRTVAIAVRTAR